MNSRSQLQLRPSTARQQLGAVMRECCGLADALLPHADETVTVEHVLDRDQRQILRLSLRDKHPIERIAEGAGQAAGSLPVLECDVEADEFLLGHLSWKVGRELYSARHFSDAHLRGYLPRRCGAHVNLVFVFGDDLACAAGQTAIASEPPHERVRVEE